VITCVVHYTIDPDQIDAFERFAREWMRLVAKHGGIHHGYFLPAEGASDRAEALFSFESLAAYERYRARFGGGQDTRRLALRPAVRADFHAPTPARLTEGKDDRPIGKGRKIALPASPNV
jgi:hypothetical protein